MSEILLCPSTMCMDFGQLEKEIKQLETAGIDIFHNDIMDGNFVPNITLGINDLKAIKKYTDKPCDVHLMIEDPGNKVNWFIEAGADIIYIHPESERYVGKTLNHIRQQGVKAGIAVNPDTAIETVQEMLNYCDYVLVMTVNPGFAGQEYIEFCTEKVRRLAQLKEKYGYKIIIDGSCSPQRIKMLKEIGADGFVLGTSALFNKGRSYKEIVQELRSM